MYLAFFGWRVGYTLGPVATGERMEDLLVRLPDTVSVTLEKGVLGGGIHPQLVTYNHPPVLEAGVRLPRSLSSPRPQQAPRLTLLRFNRSQLHLLVPHLDDQEHGRAY